RLYLHFASLAISFIETRDGTADASGASSHRPNDVIIHRIRCREATFASRHGVPHTARDLCSPEAAKLQAVARPAVRRAILFVSINEIRDLIVERDVINLRDGQLNTIPNMPAIHGNAHTAVIHHCHTVAIYRINPHFMIIAPKY